MDKSKKIKSLILIAVMILLFFQFNRRDNEDEKIKRNHSVYCATILSVRYGKDYVIEYEFLADGKLIKDNGFCGSFTANRFENGLNTVFVVTEKANPSVHRLLESTEDLRKFGITPQDTLGMDCLFKGL